MFLKLVLTFLSIASISHIQNTVITLIDVDTHLEVILLDRLDPGIKKTQNRYFEDHLSLLTIQLLKEKLKTSKAIDLTINSSTEEYLSHDNQGYPNPAIIKSAIKKLNKNNVQLAPYIQLITNVRIEGDAIGENDMLPRVQPNIEVIIKVFDNYGKITSRSTATSVYEEFIVAEEFGESGFSKSSKVHIDVLLTKINGLLVKSISRATDNLIL